jgi:hypothetical protein
MPNNTSALCRVTYTYNIRLISRNSDWKHDGPEVLYSDRKKEFALQSLLELVLTVIGLKRSELEADNFFLYCARRVVSQRPIHPDDLTGFKDLGGFSTMYKTFFVYVYVCMYVSK